MCREPREHDREGERRTDHSDINPTEENRRVPRFSVIDNVLIQVLIKGLVYEQVIKLLHHTLFKDAVCKF